MTPANAFVTAHASRRIMIRMGKLEHLQELVAALSPDESARFREWYLAFEADAWDAQMQADAAEGRLDALAAEALEAYRQGRTRPM